MKNRKTIILIILVIILASIAVYFGYNYWNLHANYIKASAISITPAKKTDDNIVGGKFKEYAGDSISIEVLKNNELTTKNYKLTEKTEYKISNSGGAFTSAKKDDIQSGQQVILTLNKTDEKSVDMIMVVELPKL